MTLLTAPIMVRTVDEALARAARAAEGGADLVEYRLDLFEQSKDELRALIERSPLPCIATCRAKSEGGLYPHSEVERLEMLMDAAGCNPTYIDVELATFTASEKNRSLIEAMVRRGDNTDSRKPGLILSAHDFDKRPADLFQKLKEMAEIDCCHIIKLAWQARSLRDNLEAFEILGSPHKPTIALCMGEFGLMSRVLAGKYGGFLTFAAVDADSPTAPGQPTLAQIKELYRWDEVHKDSAIYGVIGWPVGHSMSPAVHNAGFDALGVNAVYVPMPIPPEYVHFKATVGAFLDFEPLHFRGASVTIPHKENLIRFVEAEKGEVEPLARAIGAANTLTVREGGKLYASNSDYAAALDAVCDAMGVNREDQAGRKVAVIGAGGAARAIVAAFAGYGAEVTIYNRTQSRAQQLAEEFDHRANEGEPTFGPVTARSLADVAGSDAEVYINCTPIGMHPKVEDSPLEKPPKAIANGKAVVFDTIYNPKQTRLLREAGEAGCSTINGTEMFIRQAAAQFELWTGRQAPVEVFRRVFEARIR